MSEKLQCRECKAKIPKRETYSDFFYCKRCDCNYPITKYNVPFDRDKLEWINAKDRLPEIDKYVLLYDHKLGLVYEGKLLSHSFYCSGRYGYSKDLGEKCNITHWMPLPKPPKEECN